MWISFLLIFFDIFDTNLTIFYLTIITLEFLVPINIPTGYGQWFLFLK